MKIKFSILIATIAAAFTAVLMTGCTSTNPGVTPALVQIAVQTGVAFGVERAPQAIPELRIADNVICAAAAGTNVEPSSIVLNLELAGVVSTNSPEAVIIVNGALALYDTIFAGYGSNWVANTPQLQTYLQAICAGMNAGLPQGAPTLMRSKPLPAHLSK